MRSVVQVILASAVALSACGGSSSTSTHSTTPTDSGTTTVTDAATTVVDAGTYPPGPYGSSMGRLFQPFSLMSCNSDNGSPGTWDFAGPDFYTSTLTVLSIAAGWCVPCQMESAQLQTTIATMFQGMGVRMVQVLVQNPDHSMITSEFCSEWTARYSIQFPELMDPLMLTSVYTPAQAFPGNIIIDRHGIIRFREYGETTGLTTLVAAIQDVLANPDNPSQ